LKAAPGNAQIRLTLESGLRRPRQYTAVGEALGANVAVDIGNLNEIGTADR
jgi:hypothetical protein